MHRCSYNGKNIAGEMRKRAVEKRGVDTGTLGLIQRMHGQGTCKLRRSPKWLAYA